MNNVMAMWSWIGLDRFVHGIDCFLDCDIAHNVNTYVPTCIMRSLYVCIQFIDIQS